MNIKTYAAIMAAFFLLLQEETVYAQNVGIGTTQPTAMLHLAGNMKINGPNTLEFGAGESKEINAGKIGYGTFSPGVLDIVGGGSSASSRKIKFWNEGGAEFAGKIQLNLHSLSSTKTGINSNLLPAGIAFVQATGSKQYGTTNITTSWVTDHYVIHFSESIAGTIPVITVLTASGPRTATFINGSVTDIWVYIWSGSSKVQAGFSIAVFKT